MIPSYSSPFNFGHAGAKEAFDGVVTVEEKIDGSQFSFMSSLDGTLHCRSKGAQIHPDAPEKMFALGVETARRLTHDLIPGWVYRGEFLSKPKHNALAYDRVPPGNFILFDVDRGDQDYLSYDEKRTEAGRLGLEVVPCLYEGRIDSAEHFFALLPAVSQLGGVAAEGIVAKAYGRYAADKKTLMVKYVTEQFREVHKGEWRKDNPTNGDILETLIAQHRTPARWLKAVQHLKEAGVLQEAPQDIGALMKEVQADIEKECESEIRDALYKWAKPRILRGVVAGLPQWYKDKLVTDAFDPAAT